VTVTVGSLDTLAEDALVEEGRIGGDGGIEGAGKLPTPPLTWTEGC